MKSIYVCLAFALCATYSMESMSDGNELLVDCEMFIRQAETKSTSLNINEALRIGRCIGFIKGVRSTMQIMGSDEKGVTKVCWPSNGTDGQSALIIIKYLKEHPEKLHENETYLTMTALGIAFLCK